MPQAAAESVGAMTQPYTQSNSQSFEQLTPQVAPQIRPAYHPPGTDPTAEILWCHGDVFAQNTVVK
jgi:hypothetical protein